MKRAGPISTSSSMAASSSLRRGASIWRMSTASCSAAPPMPTLICWRRSIARFSERRRRRRRGSMCSTRFMPYVEASWREGVRLNQMTRHILGLFHGVPRARAFRRSSRRERASRRRRDRGARRQRVASLPARATGRSPPSRRRPIRSQPIPSCRARGSRPATQPVPGHDEFRLQLINQLVCATASSLGESEETLYIEEARGLRQ